MMTSSNGNIFRVTGHLCGEFTGLRWIPRTKASDAELWCVLWSVPDKRLSKQSWGWWFETQSGSLWRHSNGEVSDIHIHTCTHTHTNTNTDIQTRARTYTCTYAYAYIDIDTDIDIDIDIGIDIYIDIDIDIHVHVHVHVHIHLCTHTHTHTHIHIHTKTWKETWIHRHTKISDTTRYTFHRVRWRHMLSNILVKIGSCNGFSLVRRQAVTRTHEIFVLRFIQNKNVLNNFIFLHQVAETDLMWMTSLFSSPMATRPVTLTNSLTGCSPSKTKASSSLASASPIISTKTCCWASCPIQLTNTSFLWKSSTAWRASCKVSLRHPAARCGRRQHRSPPYHPHHVSQTPYQTRREKIEVLRFGACHIRDLTIYRQISNMTCTKSQNF